MKTKPRLITAAEWFEVRTNRGRRMTGQYAHRTKSIPIKGERSFVLGAGKTYYWRMGVQPSKELIDTIARRCPIKAAEAFLAHFEPSKPGRQSSTFARPIPRSKST